MSDLIRTFFSACFGGMLNDQRMDETESEVRRKEFNGRMLRPFANAAEDSFESSWRVDQSIGWGWIDGPSSSGNELPVH